MGFSLFISLFINDALLENLKNVNLLFRMGDVQITFGTFIWLFCNSHCTQLEAPLLFQSFWILYVFGVQSQSNEPKGCQIAKKNNQNWINIYVLPFKAMAILANCCFFIQINVKKFKPKIHLIKYLSLNFDLRLLRVNTYGIRQETILQKFIKNIHITKHIWWKKNLRR